jgi:hypothetical protein
MASKKDKEVLEVGVDVEDVLTDMSKMQRATTRSFAEIAKAVDKLNKANRRASDDAVDGAEEWEAGLEDLTKAYKKEAKEIENTIENIDLLTKKAAKANGDEKKALLENISMLKKRGAEQVKALRGKDKREGGQANAAKMFKDARGELKDALKNTISSVFSKDLKGIVEGSAKTIVKGLKLTAAGAATGGFKMKNAGAGLAERGASKGGAGGMAMQAGGMAMKGLGGMMSKLGPMLQSLAKLGPLLGMVGGALMSVVKIFLDLDAQVKGFNKDLLQSASTAEFLNQAGGNADMAFDQLKDTLDGIRDAAYSLDNVNWGLSPDQYKAIVNVLNQEGVSLSRINHEAMEAGKSVEEFTKDLAHVSVAYSRAFGVPLQQINELQSELMTEMGSNLKDTTVGFQQMMRAADDSGIAANKFFNMIRGVSQDLSLWGTRMEDAVTLLGRLGKVMNPRNAQKFMQTAAQGLKNMGRQDRLRLTLLTGQGKMGKIIDRDINRKAKGLAEKFGMSADELIKQVQTKEGRADLEGKVQKMDPSQQGAMREALIDAQLQVERKKKGAFGTATAARTLGPAAALEAMQGALMKFGGGKKLSDIVGTVGGEMMAENLGISEEQLDQMAKFEASIDNQRDVLKKQLESGDKAQQDQAREALKKAGVTAKNDEDLSKEIDKAGYDQIMDTLSDGDKKALTESAKTVDYAKSQTDLQTSMLDKIGIIVDFLMNQLYNMLEGIWDVISSIPGIGKSADQKSVENVVYKSKDKDMMKILQDSKGDLVKFRDDLIMKGGLGKGVSERLDKYFGAKSQKEKDSAAFDVKGLSDSIDIAFKYMKDGGVKNAADTLKEVKVDPKKIDEVTQSMKENGDSFVTAMTRAGLDDKTKGEAMKKSLWHMDPATLAGMTHLRTKMDEKAAEKPSATPTAPEAPVPSDQASSAAKSAATGGPGGGQAVVAPVGSQPGGASDAAKTADANLSLTKDQLDTMHSIDNQMDAFKMDTGFLSGPYSKAVENSVLAAVRTALFEYYMYKDLDQKSVVGAMEAGSFSPRSFGQTFSTAAMSGRTGAEQLDTLKPHATGGMVTGINNGLAQVTAAAGEGLASIGPGERILPARGGKGGGGDINIHVNGVGGNDLARMIEAKVIDGVHEYKRKERFT